MAEQTSSIKATCHCGAITVTVPRLPEFLNECKCTVCRGWGVAWGYYQTSEVKIDAAEGAKKHYSWGDKHIQFVGCDTCLSV
jgi:hypothetical protein